MSKQDMVNILIDLKLLTSATGKSREVLDKHGVEQETYIYKKYNIDSLQFALSNDYYSYYVTEYESIYAKVNDSLSRMKEILSLQQERELKAKKLQDSLAKIAKDSLAIDKKTIDKDSLKVLKADEKNKGKLIPPVSEK
ncbi:DUF4296 domain-containing protein [Mariniflexile ostreae]|uniref:DUF4296 domain-containing protein n=1 Tax=Mariniflexile ostreae TaxID=1520892 RepID=A0ABV5F8L0_9FLAO